MRQRKQAHTTWEELAPHIREKITPEQWEAALEEELAWQAQRAKDLKTPKDWVEPSITIEELELEPWHHDLAARLRAAGMERLGRFECIRFMFGHVLPRPWPIEYENQLPLGLQDQYMTIDKSFRRKKWDDDEPTGYE